MNQNTRRTRLTGRPSGVARQLIALGLFAIGSAAVAQNAVNPAPQSSRNELNSGKATTESVLKQTLPAVNMQPGTPSQGNARVGEPDYYNDLQARINRLKTPPQSCLQQYHLAKSQAWLNFSRDQYHENVWQKSIQSTTFEESKRIVTALETKADPGMDTPSLSEAMKLRPDLWAMAEQAKAQLNANGKPSSGYSSGNCCPSPLETAYCEVQLVWSGHALANLGGWKRANGHIRMAEDLCQQAKALVCTAPASAPAPAPVAYTPPAPVAKPAPLPAPAPMTIEPKPILVSLKVIALFYHDKYTVAEMLPESRAKLDAFAQQFKLVKVNTMSLTGFADISNSTGDQAYNDKLSAKRAATVQAYLQSQGVQIDSKGVAHQADRNPVQTSCVIPKGSDGVIKGKAAKTELEQYYACLQPNRRVEVEITGVSAK